MPNQPKQNKEGWEEEFDKIYGDNPYSPTTIGSDNFEDKKEKVKQFITKTIQERDDWWIQQIARMKREGIDLQVLINHLKD